MNEVLPVLFERRLWNLVDSLPVLSMSRKRLLYLSSVFFPPSWLGFSDSQEEYLFCVCKDFKNFRGEQQVGFHFISVHCILPSLWGWR